MQVRLEVVTAVTDELVEGMRALLAQLSTSAPPSRDALTAVVTCPGVGASMTAKSVRLARAAANRLYERAGFELRDSKVYRLTL